MHIFCWGKHRKIKEFPERLEKAIDRYHANAVSTVEVIQELFNLAKDIREARLRGEATGLSEDEIAFYDALAENQSAVDVMGDASLRVIAHELLTSLKGSVAVDWAHWESARARMRVLVKRILRKYGYPPDLQDAAIHPGGPPAGRGVVGTVDGLIPAATANSVAFLRDQPLGPGCHSDSTCP